ncbi:hypothetical protein ACWD7T_09680, partial [Streptomyces sp. 900116325]
VRTWRRAVAGSASQVRSAAWSSICWLDRLGELLHRELRQRSISELRRRRPRGSAEDLIASAVAGLFTGVLADWVHGRTDATPAQLAGGIWRMLLAVHAAAAPR